MTEPENWSPNAMYQATRIFSSNLGVKRAQRFYNLVLLPRIRDDIRKNKRLHFALYQSIKKSLYKPAAFNKGILFPLCQVWNRYEQIVALYPINASVHPDLCFEIKHIICLRYYYFITICTIMRLQFCV